MVISTVASRVFSLLTRSGRRGEQGNQAWQEVAVGPRWPGQVMVGDYLNQSYRAAPAVTSTWKRERKGKKVRTVARKVEKSTNPVEST